MIADLVNYLRTAWSNHAEPNAVEWSVGNWRAFADIPAKLRQPDLICPLLPPAVSQPALDMDPAMLLKSAFDPDTLQQAVEKYVQARPKSSEAETVEALTSAYCRAVVSEKVSMAQSGAKVATFSQDVAIALSHARKATGS